MEEVLTSIQTQVCTSVIGDNCVVMLWKILEEGILLQS